MSSPVARLIEMCGDVWTSMNAYTDQFDKGSKGVASVEVSAIDLVNWCQVIGMATRGLHERITNENLSDIQYHRLLAKYEQAEAAYNFERKRLLLCRDALKAILPFIPITSAQEGGASAYSENVRAADKVREALDTIEVKQVAA